MWTNLTANADQLDHHFRPVWSKWISRLPDEQQQALRTYKSPGYAWFAMARNASRALPARAQALHHALDAALASSQWPFDTVVWRGFRAWQYPDGSPPSWEPPKIGSIQTFDMWTSTSLVETAAAVEACFAQAEPNDWSVLFEMHLPAGHPAIYMEPLHQRHTGEAEVLLPRGTQYEVIGFEPIQRLRTFIPRQPFYGFRLTCKIQPFAL